MRAREWEGGLKGVGLYLYLWLIHIVVQQKTTQHCKAVILQLKINLKKEPIFLPSSRYLEKLSFDQHCCFWCHHGREDNFSLLLILKMFLEFLIYSFFHVKFSIRFIICISPWSISHSVVSDSLPPPGLQPARVFCPWSSLGKNTRVGCHSPYSTKNEVFDWHIFLSFK